jgi:hypothetical protein
MAVEHIVIMKLRESLTEQQLAALCRDCEAHFEKIPGVLSASMGANIHPSQSGFTHAIVIRLEHSNALASYLRHPEHVAAGKRLSSVFADFVIIDLQTDES